MKISISYSQSYADFYRATFEDLDEAETLIKDLVVNHLGWVPNNKRISTLHIFTNLLKAYTYLLDLQNKEVNDYLKKNSAPIKALLRSKLVACDNFKPHDKDDRVALISCKNKLNFLLNSI